VKLAEEVISFIPGYESYPCSITDIQVFGEAGSYRVFMNEVHPE
jgi:hypothetical protein